MVTIYAYHTLVQYIVLMHNDWLKKKESRCRPFRDESNEGGGPAIFLFSVNHINHDISYAYYVHIKIKSYHIRDTQNPVPGTWYLVPGCDYNL